MPDPPRITAEERLVMALARRNRRARRRPTIVTWYDRPYVTVGWPLHLINIYLN